jgi:predicted Zn finger-like uncharacterized protein
MRNGSVLSGEKDYVVVTLQCPRCKASQKVYIAANVKFGQAGGEKVSCINCDHHFKVTIPDRITGEPFPA